MEQRLVMDGDLISRRALIEDFEWLKSVVNESSKGEVEETIRRIRNAAAVDAKLVVHGRWGEYEFCKGWPCTACGVYVTGKEPTWAHCPNCGAEMDPPKVKYMTREEMIAFIKETPGVRVSHSLFSEEEYLSCSSDGNVYDENGYLFEDWYSEGPGRWAGIRDRVGGDWETGWFLKKK